MAWFSPCKVAVSALCCITRHLEYKLEGEQLLRHTLPFHSVNRSASKAERDKDNIPILLALEE